MGDLDELIPSSPLFFFGAVGIAFSIGLWPLDVLFRAVALLVAKKKP